jgi:hypothetical protein
MALVFTPSAWFDQGPFAFQLSRPVHYAVYFFAGVGVGAGGIERGLLVPGGALVRRWAVWGVAALGLLLVWRGLTGLTMADGSSTSLALQILADLSFVLACFASCCCVLATVLRFAAKRLPAFAGLKRGAYGMYLVHYGGALPAVIKGAVVFGGTLLLSGVQSQAFSVFPRSLRSSARSGLRGQRRRGPCGSVRTPRRAR